MAERHTFPESGDNDDPENFAQMVGHEILSDVVVTGFGFDVDYTAPSVTIGTGLCFVRQDSGTASSTNETRLETNYAVQLPQTTISLSDNTTNYIYVVPQIGSDDSATFQSYTSQTGAGSDSLHIGTVDTVNDTSSTTNRDPHGAFDSIDVNSTFDLFDDADLSFGTDGDFVIAYDSTNNLLSLDDGTGADLLDVQDGGPVQLGTVLDLNNNNLVDGNTVIWDTSNQYVPLSALEHDSLDVVAGDGLKSGGTVALGGTTTVDVEPSDFAGVFLSDDGSDNLTVNIGRGLENDGSGNIRFDEDTAYTFTSSVGFTSAIDLTNANAIQSTGADAIQFDSNQNVVVPNGYLDVDEARNRDLKEYHTVRESWGDISTSTFSQSLDVSGTISGTTGTAWNGDGSKIYFVDEAVDSVYSWTLSTPFDLSTASFNQTFDVSTETGTPSGVSWNGDGSKMYVVGYNNRNVYSYTLTTAYDISTASFNQSFSVGNEISGPEGMAWSSSGTKLYVVNTDTVQSYELTTAYDLSTASPVQSLNVGTEDSLTAGIAWSSDGSTLYTIGSENDNVNSYSLTTPYDISTATFEQSFDVSSRDISPAAVMWNDVGTKMYFLGSNSDTVYSYTVDHVHSVSLDTSNVERLVLQSGTQIQFDGVNSSMENQATLRIQQDSSGGHSVSFSNVRWEDGTKPEFSTSSNALDIAGFIYDPDDDMWDGKPGGFDFA